MDMRVTIFAYIQELEIRRERNLLPLFKNNKRVLVKPVLAKCTGQRPFPKSGAIGGIQKADVIGGVCVRAESCRIF